MSEPIDAETVQTFSNEYYARTGHKAVYLQLGKDVARQISPTEVARIADLGVTVSTTLGTNYTEEDST